MNALDFTRLDCVKLLAAYRAAAIAHGAATERGDHRKANRQHDIIAAIYRELRRRGEDARGDLLPLLNDIDPHVRAWVAAHALEFAPEQAEPVLRHLATGTGAVALNAEMTLQEWEKGSLAFP